MQLANTPPLQSTAPGLHPVGIHQTSPLVRGSKHPIINNNNNTICIVPIKSEDTDTEALGGAGLSPAKQMCL